MSGAAKGRPAPQQPVPCSVVWDNAGASTLGTAPVAKFWVALEQNGPWGREAATQSRLDPGVGLDLDRSCRDAGGRFVLIRRPGAHSDRQGDGRQRAYLAGGLGGRPWLVQADLENPTQLLQLPWAALSEGTLAGLQDTLPEFERSPTPVLLVCTNSKRDVCCAVRGRPVALESSSRRPGQVWECSHTGGHRFSPTGVLLPYGQTFARLSGPSALLAVDAATRGEVPLELMGPGHDRGRSHLAPPEQAAESAVRHQIKEPRLLALSTSAAAHPGSDNSWHCRVRHVDGRSWDVVAVRESGSEDRPESCGKAPVPTWQWSVLGGSTLSASAR